ncbi:regucalcin [Fomitiporia mediterranea MF3/22]|uniref:regucalcin n=1 Tax=Fomitiporia mediterranea (strain MF3/22) TaxID=694068 RepID=UPI0004407D36|nr:regucalcin [Fomitiporia mediterranea MF3/22]EJD03564.1 regucalcin [Fomitiporia mediterranea MF3/22]
MSPDHSLTVDKPLINCNCTLGEGPLYDDSTATLHFVDIVEKRVLHFNTITKELQVDQYNEAVSCLALRHDGQGLACAAAQGFALIDPQTRELTYVSKPLPPDQVNFVRFNDGACDRSGRFFAGTVCSKDPQIPGQLYRYDPSSGTATLVDAGPFTDCNGLGWSADEKTMYLTDSLVNRIYAYDYNDGVLSNKRLFVDTLALGLPKGTYPDGLCIDSEGCVWSARWGGSKVVRHSADGSSILFEIHFPTALNITACSFGGVQNDQLFVTTAHCGAIGGDASRQQQFPDSGNVFQVDLSGRFKGGQWRYKFAQ